LAGCRRYAIVTAYISGRAPWTGTLRRLAGAGASIVFKDEVSRRVVVRVPAPALGGVLAALEGVADSVGVEVKAYCPGSSRACWRARGSCSRGPAGARWPMAW